MTKVKPLHPTVFVLLANGLSAELFIRNGKLGPEGLPEKGRQFYETHSGDEDKVVPPSIVAQAFDINPRDQVELYIRELTNNGFQVSIIPRDHPKHPRPDEVFLNLLYLLPVKAGY